MLNLCTLISYLLCLALSLLPTQVCTDSASSCKRAGEIIMAKYRHITWAPCAAHCVDLLLEDIGKLPWVSPTIDDAR